MTLAVMLQGTASDVGKSVLVAGLCRIFHQDGLRTAPFKSQNMALNSGITPDGKEMGRAQIFQAEAAGIAPDVRMNPILLKPTSDRQAQVVLMGQVATSMDAVSYHQYKPRLREQILAVYQSLAGELLSLAQIEHDHAQAVRDGTLIRRIEARQSERRRRLADKRRRHIAGVEVKPDSQQHDEQDKADQRPEKTVHARASTAAADAGSRRTTR